MLDGPSNHDEPQKLIDLIRRLAARLAPRRIKIMEVCGTHTVTAQACGLHALLPENVRLISGPGCPVCVTPAGYIEQSAALALEHKTHIMTYGDMIRVPGVTMSLEDARRRGGHVSVVYSVQQAINVARQKPKQPVVFLGIGFETTAPATAIALKTAKTEGLDNFLVFLSHKTIIPAMETLLQDAALAIDGFIAPGHVSVIIGTQAYTHIPVQYRRPCVITGFDATQMLMAIAHILIQRVNNEPCVENVYGSRVSDTGNRQALQLIKEVFAPSACRWRGLGVMDRSGLKIRADYADHDAGIRFNLSEPQDTDPDGCCCADVIKGIVSPTDCPLFAESCTPNRPIGACMVSREGACSAVYRYRKMERPNV